MPKPGPSYTEVPTPFGARPQEIAACPNCGEPAPQGHRVKTSIECRHCGEALSPAALKARCDAWAITPRQLLAWPLTSDA